MEAWSLGPPILVGEKVKWYENNNKISHSGVVRWIGKLPEISTNWTIGIELDKPLIFGGNDGNWKNRKLFPCKPKHGLLVPIEEVVREVNHKEKKHSPIEVRYRNRSSPIVNGSLYISSPELYQRHRLSTIQDEESSRCDETPVVNGKESSPKPSEKRTNQPISYCLRKKKKSRESLNVSSPEVSCNNLTTPEPELSQENHVRKIHRRRKHHSKIRNCSNSDKSSDESSDLLKKPRNITENAVNNKNLVNKNLNDFKNKEISQPKNQEESLTPTKENHPVATPRRKTDRHRNRKNDQTSKTIERSNISQSNDNIINEKTSPSNNFKYSEKRHSLGNIIDNNNDDSLLFDDFNSKLLMMNGLEIPNDPRREVKNSKGIFSFLKWFKKNKSIQDLEIDASVNSSPLLIKRNHNSSFGSLDTLLSTATVTSFAFVTPTQYQKQLTPKEEVKEEVKPEIVPEVEAESQKEAEKVRNLEGYSTGTTTGRRKKRRAPDPPSLPNTFKRTEEKENKIQHRRTVSESFKDKKAGAYCHVKGKRKAPSPPKLYPSLDRLKNEYPSLARKKKPAPAPPPPPPPQPSPPPPEEEKPKIQAKPWYKRSVKEKNTEKIKKDKEYEDWIFEVGFSRPNLPNDFKFNKIFPWNEDKKKEEKRKSQITMLANISELDREAAEILRKEQAQEKEAQAAQDAKFYSDLPNNSTKELISMFNAISDLNTRPIKKIQKPENHSVWVCSKCTLENDQGRIVCAACNVPKIAIDILDPMPKIQKPIIDWEKELQFYCPKRNLMKSLDEKKFERKNGLIDIASFEDRAKEKKRKELMNEEDDKTKLKEILKEMKNSLPKHEKNKNKPNEEKKVEKVESSAQTNTKITKNSVKIGKGVFELIQESDLENIVKNKAGERILNHVYANVKNLSFVQDGGSSRDVEKEKDKEVDVKEMERITTELADFKADMQAMAPTTNMNTLSINNLLKKLEAAIANGQHSQAADLAKELAKMKITCNVTRLRPSPEPVKEITVDLYVEDKVSHQGPIPLKVTPSMTVTDLKLKVEKQFEIPTNVQRWILGKQLASDDGKTLENHGVAENGCSIFLYLVAPEKKEPVKPPEKPPPIRQPSPVVVLKPAERISSKQATPSPFKEFCSNDEREIEEDEAEKLPEPEPEPKPIVEPPKPEIKEEPKLMSEAAALPSPTPQPSAPQIPEQAPQISEQPPQILKPIPKKPKTPILAVEPRINEALKKELKVISVNAVKQTIDKLNMTHIGATKTDRIAGWKCNVCTLVNSSARPGCAACSAQKPFENSSPKPYQKIENKPQSSSNAQGNDKIHYLQLLHLDNAELVPNMEDFECPVCLVNYAPGEGVVLRECLHTFCRTCLINTVQYSEEAEVKCPYRDDNYSCDSILQQREIKALVPRRIFEQHLARSVSQAENKIQNTFHCKTPDCKGWCILEDNVNEFHCPVCSFTNCLTCQAIHTGINCKEYQEQMTHASETNPEAKKSREMLEEMVERGEAMVCPVCQVVLMKKWGCDWLKCSMCKTEICWVTRKPRWGPGGKGDTSAGCQCGVNGVKCHPKCNYCH